MWEPPNINHDYMIDQETGQETGKPTKTSKKCSWSIVTIIDVPVMRFFDLGFESDMLQHCDDWAAAEYSHIKEDEDEKTKRRKCFFYTWRKI